MHPEAAALLRELAQPPQGEPVADPSLVICPECCAQFRAIPVSVQRLMIEAGFEPPFTAHPPQRQPLTPEQIKAIWWQCEQKRRNHPTNEWWLQFARAVERAAAEMTETP